MDTKLTLRMDDELIASAKRYAHRTGKSVSRLVADYFALLDAQELGDDELPPSVRRLVGALAGANVDESDYYRYLEEKYL